MYSGMPATITIGTSGIIEGVSIGLGACFK